MRKIRTALCNFLKKAFPAGDEQQVLYKEHCLIRIWCIPLDGADSDDEGCEGSTRSITSIHLIKCCRYLPFQNYSISHIQLLCMQIGLMDT